MRLDQLGNIWYNVLMYLQQTAHATSPLAARIAGQVAIFAGVLTGVLLLSWVWVLPRLTRIPLQGELLSAQEVVRHVQTVQEQIEEFEHARLAAIHPLQDPRYEALVQEKHRSENGERIMDVLTAAADQAGITREQLFIGTLQRDAHAEQIRITGDIRSAGTSSMTLLAAFVEALRADKSVSALTPPVFTRVNDPTIGTHSPFEISFRLAVLP